MITLDIPQVASASAIASSSVHPPVFQDQVIATGNIEQAIGSPDINVSFVAEADVTVSATGRGRKRLPITEINMCKRKEKT